MKYRRQKFLVLHGSQVEVEEDYCLLEVRTGKVVFKSNSKCEVIAESQKRNGFTTVDGDERTYSRQTDH